MEDALRVEDAYRFYAKEIHVLILIVMEDALRVRGSQSMYQYIRTGS